MATIQVRRFGANREIFRPEDVDSVIDSVLEEVNTFISSLDPQNVLNVTFDSYQVGKYGRICSYHAYVTYLAI